MNITKESTGDLTATLKVEIAEEDYQPQVDQVLKERRKEASMPGFRPGKVPLGMIKKMLGKTVTLDEVNKVLTEGITKYIDENDIEIFGHPLPNKEKSKEIDVGRQKSFEFYFDIGIIPEFEPDLSEKVRVDYYRVKAGDDDVDNYSDQVRKKYGSLLEADQAEAGDVVGGTFTELNEDGSAKEEGISNETSIHLDYIKDEQVRKKFEGAKKEEEIIFNPLEAIQDVNETARMLDIKKETAEHLKSNFRFKIDEIKHVEPAELNEEFFGKVFPNEEVKTEEEFREKIRKEIERQFEAESDKIFSIQTLNMLLDNTDLPLPDDFLKRYLKEGDPEKELSDEQIEENYDDYARSLKSRLIINRIIKDHDLEVEEQDVKDHIKSFIGGYYFQGKRDEETQKHLDAIVDSMMQNKEETEKIYDQLYDERIRKLFKEKLTLNEKVATRKEFNEIVDKINKQESQ